MRTFACRCSTETEIIPPSPHAGYVVLGADVDASIDDRTDAIRSFLSAVREGNRGGWLADFYGKDVSRSNLGDKDDADVIEDILSKHDSWTHHMFRCPICGRVYIQRQPGLDLYQCYSEEPNDPRDPGGTFR